MNIPDTRLARQATEMVREVSPPFLFHHCLRTFHFAAALGEQRGISYDGELLYLSTLLHDLGLVPEDTPATDRFEVDGADRAYRFLVDRGMPNDRAATVWDAVALHTSVGIATRKGPEVALTHLGAAADITGLGIAQLDTGTVQGIVELHPRLGMKAAIRQTLVETIRRNPRSATFTWMAEFGRSHIADLACPSMDQLISASPFDE